ncbi:MAG: ATP-dependent Clp protease proteolytic subunit [Lachnospiraceae bacterium]|nr:ATP-dependent Clp protease proteolytic subunit [Lachnospiraceae bacterium]
MRNQKDTDTKKTKNELAEKLLLESRIIFICGEINQELAKDVSTQLLYMKAMGDDPITIFINSQGGHVEAGDTIHDMIQYIGLPINMIGTGWVASAGITIYLAAEKEKRFSLPNTRFMIHQPLGGVNGRATDIAIEAEEIVKTRKRIERLISEATGQPLERVSKDADQNYWMDTEEAINYGIVSRVIAAADEIE